MANLNSRSIAVTLALFLVAGCGSRAPYQLNAPRSNPSPLPVTLNGKLTILDQGTLDLAQASDRPVVLIFSQDTCSVCGHEADKLVQDLPVKGRAPSKVRLFTILVGATLEDALDWKQAHCVPWSVGIDENLELFKQYCSRRSVPCNVVFVPGKGVVLNKDGAADYAELAALTGPWTGILEDTP